MTNTAAAMTDTSSNASLIDDVDEKTRKRPKPGERRVQILQTLAGMLEQPDAEKVTTAALAAKLQVSEAALYRHFASKAQMYEALIEFVEQSVFALINQIIEREPNGTRQAHMVVAVLLNFADKNRGMTRVMIGDALVNENERLQQRMNLFFDKVESALKQCLRLAAEAGDYGQGFDAAVRANVLMSFVLGRLQRFAKSGFKRLPTEAVDQSLTVLLS
jgi:TetR/AcrR family transcriptional regulator